MGFYTFTDASCKEIPLRRDGEVKTTGRIAYHGRIVYVKPDDTCVMSDDYDGYGMIGDDNVFVLLVEQNREHITEIMNMIKEDPKVNFDLNLECSAKIYEQYGDCGELVSELEALAHARPEYRTERNLTTTGWKRLLGIEFMQVNDRLPFPMKVTKRRHYRPYDELVPSKVIQ